jgi:hypothetical protein
MAQERERGATPESPPTPPVETQVEQPPQEPPPEEPTTPRRRWHLVLVLCIVAAALLLLFLLPTKKDGRLALKEDPFTTAFRLVEGTEVEHSRHSDIRYTIAPLYEPPFVDEIMAKLPAVDKAMLQMQVNDREVKLILHNFTDEEIESFLGLLSKDAVLFTKYAIPHYAEPLHLTGYKIFLLERVDVYSSKGYDYANTIPLPKPEEFDKLRGEHKESLKNLRHSQAELAALKKCRETRNRLASTEVDVAAIKEVLGVK